MSSTDDKGRGYYQYTEGLELNTRKSCNSEDWHTRNRIKFSIECNIMHLAIKNNSFHKLLH